MVSFRLRQAISLLHRQTTPPHRRLLPTCRWRMLHNGIVSSPATNDVQGADPAILLHSRSIVASSLPTNRSIVTVTVTQSSPTEETQDTTSSSSPPQSTRPDDTIHDVGDLLITQNCVSRIQQLASTKPNPQSMYLRLYVDAGGCSGFQYKFLLLSQDTANNNNDGTMDPEEDGTIDPEEDVVYNINGSRLVIDQTSLELLRGSTIDYVQEMIRSSFAVINNPNSESACGCGSSFAVKKFQANPALD